MEDDLISFDLPVERSSIIKVVGIGGGGNNAVNHMFDKGIKDVNFVVCNTDHQALARSQVPVKVQLGASITEGRGAGSKPEVGRQAAMENIGEVMDAIGGNTKMVFLTTGMGGGTGTGAIPVIAKACRDAGYLTVAVVTIPFKSEGKVRINYAIEGISHLGEHVDSLLVINNEKLREIYGDLGVSAAFAKADDILATAVKGIAEIITVAGYINVDFADVETVMKDSGVSIMGMGLASGEDRARTAIENALSSPLLNSNDITGARSILVNIASGKGENELTMDELGQITDYMYEASSEDALIIRGLSQDESLGKEISVTVIATGFPSNSILTPYKRPKPKKVELLAELHPVPPHIIPDRGENTFAVVQKSPQQESSDFEEEKQGRLHFDHETMEEITPVRSKRESELIEERENQKSTLQKVKHMQNFFKKEGLSNKIIKDNIEAFEDVPAYVRRNMVLSPKDKEAEIKVSKFTLEELADGQGPVLRDNNAYLNDNVD